MVPTSACPITRDYVKQASDLRSGANSSFSRFLVVWWNAGSHFAQNLDAVGPLDQERAFSSGVGLGEPARPLNLPSRSGISPRDEFATDCPLRVAVLRRGEAFLPVAAVWRGRRTALADCPRLAQELKTPAGRYAAGPGYVRYACPLWMGLERLRKIVALRQSQTAGWIATSPRWVSAGG